MASKTVLVTGGAGFVGSNLVRGLLADGVGVRVLDDLTVAGGGLLAGLDVDLRKGSVTDPAAVRRASKGVDAVVHLAALSGVAPSVDHPDRDFAINVGGTFNVLDAARRADVGHVVFASSGAVLAGATPPLHEKLPLQPLSPYGASKAYGESAVLSFANVFGFTGVALRFSNVYGPYCGHKESVVAAFLRNAVQRKPFRIYGTGRQTRDFLYVDDVVAAIRAALASDRSDVYQLGTGVETSVNELAKAVAEVAGIPLDVDRRPPRPGEAARNVSDISKAKRKLRWKPAIDLRDGLGRTLAWMREDAEARRSGRARTR
jgi:UDP-glucose 4-epimerase